ncbi:MAG: aldehyde ferredoxin oxidoreductase [Desulfobacterales bacterium]|nr:aldehyde ferredoxin oxidoreductase [Desulfobacterales bacterium]
MNNKILKIDLNTNSIKTEDIDKTIYQEFIGGKGIAGLYLKPHITKSWDDPTMPLIFMCGPLVGTSSPTSGRSCVMSKSPLTGTICDSSVGGTLGFNIRKAGYEGFIITGKSNKLCGIEICDDSIKIVSAEKYKEWEIGKLHNTLKKKGSVVSIGPAAENGVLFSNIMIDRFFCAGRGGLGMIQAAKNLKYITVKGTGKIAVHDKLLLQRAREDIFRLIAASPIIMGEHGIANFGTGALYDLIGNRRMMPTGNFKKTVFDGASNLNAFSYKKKYNTKKAGCKGCHIQCKQVGKDNEHIPEFETMSHFSALINNDKIDIVTEANRICNEQGIDTISAASTIACYSEITQQKLSGDKIISLLQDICKNKGEGAALSKGSYYFAKENNKPELSFSVKGLELPAYDPRGAYGMALAYAVSTRGACHLRAYPISHEIIRKPVATDRFSFDGKARIIKISEDMNAIIDSLTACKFAFFGCSLEEFAMAYTAVTGLEMSAHQLISSGERIYYNERIMNWQNGFTRVDDSIPKRFFNEEGSHGNNIKIPSINKTTFEKTLSDYYKIRGLNENGEPTQQKANELGLTL